MIDRMIEQETTIEVFTRHGINSFGGLPVPLCLTNYDYDACDRTCHNNNSKQKEALRALTYGRITQEVNNQTVIWHEDSYQWYRSRAE